MKSACILLLACFISAVSFAQGTIKLPNKENLEKKLSNIVGVHFLQETNLVEELAQKELYPVGIGVIVAEAYNTYVKRLQTLFPENTEKHHRIMLAVNGVKPLLYEALVKKDPKAFAELEKGGYLGPMVGKSKL